MLSISRILIAIATACIALTLIQAPSAHAQRANTCTDVPISGKREDVEFRIRTQCKKQSRTQPPQPASEPVSEVTAPGAREKPAIEQRTVDACFPNQENNSDFGTCREQTEAFCPEGAWVREQFVDTTRPDRDPYYSRPECVTAVSPGPATDGAPPVSIDEVRTLLVLKPEIRSDNGGRGIRNAETNFYADAETRTLVTTLNGVEVELRATPVSFRWDYGDGSPTKTTSVAGQSQPEFNVPTPTSHVYEDTGQYTVRLTTVYIGEYREAGGEWVLIPGTISLDSAPVTANIWRTITRNVADDCSVDSSAWGCTGPIESTPAG